MVYLALPAGICTLKIVQSRAKLTTGVTFSCCIYYRRKIMADNPSFSKELVKGFFVSMVRVLAIGVGLAILLIAFTILFRKPSGPYHTTTAEVLPNHNWEQGPLSSTAPTILQLDIEGVVGSDHLTYRDIRDQLVDTINGEIKKD